VGNYKTNGVSMQNETRGTYWDIFELTYFDEPDGYGLVDVWSFEIDG